MNLIRHLVTGSSLTRRVSVIGGIAIVAVMLTLSLIMQWMSLGETRGHVEENARLRVAAVTQTIDAFDDTARAMTERFYKIFAETMVGEYKLDEASGQLALDGLPLNESYARVDAFGFQTGGVATIFARKGDDFVRISTTVKKENGDRAVGTQLGAKHPAYETVMAGKAWVGRATLFGKPFMTRYQPVKDVSDKIVGILFVGYDVSTLQATLDRMVAEGKLFDTGGLVVIDPKKDPAEAVFVAAVNGKGKKVTEAVPGAAATLAAFQDAGGGRLSLAVPLVAPGQDRWALVARSERTGWWVMAEVSDDEATGGHKRQAMLVAGLFVLIGIGLAGGLAWVMHRQVSNPLRDLGSALASVAAGDLTHAVQVRRRDEIGTLAEQAETMRRKLAETIAEVRVAAESIQTASAEVAAGNVDLSQRTESAASNLQQTAASVEELTGTVRQSADSASQANQLASSASDFASRGGDVVHQVVQTMDEISQASRRITDIIGTIDGIAFQTNILALNAAVEAARAGEQGRGFAVVAGEVRTLAQRSAEAAREIKSLIGASVERVETGSRLVQAAGGTMEEIVTSVRRVGDIIGEISAATQEQQQGFSQVNQAVDQLDQMTQQNAALVEEGAAAAHSMNEQARRLTALVQSFRT